MAALIAGLYVLLCTVGSVTHVHAFVGMEAEVGESVDTPEPASNRGEALCAIKRTPPPPVHCAFCEWQASSVSAALSPQHFALSIPAVFDLPPFAEKAGSVSLPYASSRAPPVA